ncbi:unnamed protein product [Effrenium voratum]|uniref:Multidrug resistance-associated protein 1 n=1 Tax=Effrenium voratum TaxID=2562239 RepID=A0AA36HYA9_9DINO|nr:unnamed protein product [Effrenium voratum]
MSTVELCNLEDGLFAGQGFNDCVVHIILQAAVAGLAIVGVLVGLVIIRQLPRSRQPITLVDRMRSASCALLFLVSLAEFVVSLTTTQVVSETQGIGGACIAAAAVAVGFYHQQEVHRSLSESMGLKLWWVLATVAQVLAIYDQKISAAWAFKGAELLLCLSATAAYLVPSGRSGSTAEPPLLAEENGISMVGRWARTLSAREASPEEQVGILGWLAFTWFTPIVDLAFERDKENGKLEPTDVYPLTRKNVAQRQLERLDRQWQVELRKPQPALLSAMTRGFFAEVFSTAWVKLINDVLHFVGPFLLNRIINFVKGTGEEAGEPLWMGYAYAVGMVLSSGAQAFLMAHYFQGGYQTGMRLRTGLILMAYSKALRVLPWATPQPEEAPPEPQTRRCCKKTPKKRPTLPTGGMGQMTNIISADTDKFTFLMPYFNLIWSCPLQIVICFFMLFKYVSFSLFAGVVVMILFTILSSTVAGKARKIQAEAMKAKDERLKMEVELLKIVKIIKFYAWELAIEDKVKELRNKELALQLRYKLWNVALFLSFSLSPVLVALGTFASYTLVQKRNLDAATAFTALSLFNILSFPLGAMPMMARFFMEAAVAKDRIEAFLLSPEVAPRPGAASAGTALELKSSKLAWPDKTVAFSGSYEEFKRSGAVSDEVVHEDPEPEPDAAPAEEEKKEVKEAPKKEVKPVKAAATQEERRSGAVSWQVYLAYVKACGGVPAVGAFLLAVAVSEGSRNFSDGWLAHWSGSGGASDGLAIYALAALICLVTGVAYSTTRVLVGQRGSRVLHENCLHALLRAHMSFFDLTPNGQILNRLAEDTNILDYNLPQTMSANIIWFWRAASIVVVCMMVGWYLIFLMVPMFFLYAKLAKRYLPATRDLRRLDAAARSPIFSHFSESMHGVSTIRAMQQQERCMHTNTARLESQMEAYYLSNTAARWLSLRLQFNGTILVGAVCILGIYLSTNKQVSAGVMGLAITYALRLTDTLNQVNRESADRETQMVSVERVQNYVTNVKQEAALRIPHAVPPKWPDHGNVTVDNVMMRYREGLPIVLNGISLNIKERERVGIVGRTGCGKSSFLSTLLRLVELEAGHITMDGVDISNVGLHDLRETVAMIPQDPAILTGSVRFNLDPFGAKTDEELWEALEKAQLKPRVDSAGGLDSKVEEGGGNFSVGELQLLCLSRALLRRQESGGLLLLDEATSALDAETDQTIQKVIRSDFNCTIITIAHRIQTLLDYDKVAVFESGKVVEFDSPQELLKRPSKFQALAKEGGVAV